MNADSIFPIAKEAFGKGSQFLTVYFGFCGELTLSLGFSQELGHVIGIVAIAALLFWGASSIKK